MWKSVVWTLVIVAVAAFGFWAGYAVREEGLREEFDRGLTRGELTCYPVYGLNVNSMAEEVLLCFPIPDSLNVEDKLRVLADRLSTSVYGRLPIDVLGIENRSGRMIAKVNLKEVRNERGVGGWYIRFQGSTGGALTQYGLEQTFLQREYKGQWIDGIEFYYDGQPFTEEWDHINLSGVKMRDRMASVIGTKFQI